MARKKQEQEVVEEKVTKAEVVEQPKAEQEETVKISLRDCEVLKHMVLTEKTQKLTKEENVLTLNVKKGVKKSEVKHAVENYFNVKVDDVRILNCRGKLRTVGRFKGTTSATRKAYCKVNKQFDLVKMAEEAQSK